MNFFCIGLIKALLFSSWGDMSAITINDTKEALIINDTKEYLDSLFRAKYAFIWKKWEKPDPKYVHLSDDILKHVAKGHVVIDVSLGDIDENGISDLIVITGVADEDSLILTKKALPRHLLIFLDQKNFAFRNEKAIPCIRCCGEADPYEGHLARSGTFIIRESCIKKKKYRTEYQFVFYHKINEWLLENVVTETSDLNDDKVIINILTQNDFGKHSLKTFALNDFKAKYKQIHP